MHGVLKRINGQLVEASPADPDRLRGKIRQEKLLLGADRTADDSTLPAVMLKKDDSKRWSYARIR